MKRDVSAVLVFGLAVFAGCDRGSPSASVVSAKPTGERNADASASGSLLDAPPYPTGRLGKEMGSIVAVRGVVVTDARKLERGVFWLEVRSVDGEAVKSGVRLPLQAYFGGWGDQSGGKGPPKLEVGGSFELTGYESGAFVGSPDGAMEAGGVALPSTGFHFRHVLIVLDGKAIEPFAPLQDP